MLKTKTSFHLKKLIEKYPEIKKQFIPSNAEEILEDFTFDDPLLEEKNTPVKGLIHTYKNRALVLLTMKCAAYCRFCTRRRTVSEIKKGNITEKDLNNMAIYIKRHKEIREIIISGGDPLTEPDLLKKALKKFSAIAQIKILRVGTRLPVSDPKMINQKVISALKIVKKQPLYVMLHFEHPAEITKSTIKALKKLQSVSTMLLSQSVFLKGINDNFDVLYELFTKLTELGVKPYYIFRCDYVKGAGRFVVNFKKEIEIMTELRKRLSGLACPVYAICTPNGEGKIPPPLNFWKFDRGKYMDFNGKEIINFDI
jgi:lysine 2,3-aminomutase